MTEFEVVMTPEQERLVYELMDRAKIYDPDLCLQVLASCNWDIISAQNVLGGSSLKHTHLLTHSLTHSLTHLFISLSSLIYYLARTLILTYLFRSIRAR